MLLRTQRKLQILGVNLIVGCYRKTDTAQSCLIQKLLGKLWQYVIMNKFNYNYKLAEGLPIY